MLWFAEHLNHLIFRTKKKLATFSPMPQHSQVGKGLLIIESSWLHSDTPSSIGLLWTCDQPDAENLPHNREKPMSPAGFEPAIPASERQQTHALGLASTGISIRRHTVIKVNRFSYKLSVILVIVWKKYLEFSRRGLLKISNVRFQ